MPLSTVKYAKESITVKCEELSQQACAMLDWDKFRETHGNLTQGERDCLEQLIPSLHIAAELFRQCSKNER